MNSLLKFTVSFLMFAAAASAWAAPFTVVDQSTGASYQCGNSAPTNPGGTALDPSCAQELTDYCYANTSRNRDQCFTLISSNRGCGLAGYSACVQQTQSYCYSNTSMNHESCFDQALATCRGGNFSQTLLDAVALQASKKAESKFQRELESMKQKAGNL